jgi:hypothetical protein
VTKTDTGVTIIKTGVRRNSKKNTAATWSTVPGQHWFVRTMPVLAVENSIYTVA